jgi:hypothetical protein
MGGVKNARQRISCFKYIWSNIVGELIVNCWGEAVGCRLSDVIVVLVVDCRLLLSFFFVGAHLCHRS